jgi:microcystin-dependent protein
MSQPYVGEIRCFGFNFAPRDWAFCNGQIMAIAQNPTLFSILGTTYGGDGVTTYGLPNLQGQIPMHWGHGTGGLNTVIGQVQGQTTVALTVSQMPAHNHPISSADPGNLANRFPGPSNTAYLSAIKGSQGYQNPPVTPNASFSLSAISTAGGSLPHDNMQPYLALNFCIALFGNFPSRN